MSTAQQEVITASEAATVASDGERRSLITTFANRYGIEPNRMMATLRATAFKVSQGEVTNEQMAALLVVANQYGLNPFTKEIYAYPDKKNGIVPVVGVDGWSRIINEHPNFDGMDFEHSDKFVRPEEIAKDCPDWIECVMHRKDRSHPIKVREYLDETYRPAFVKDGRPLAGPWQTHTKRMLRHKAVIQAARLAFGFVGIYDEDEAQRIVEAPIIDVTPAKDEKGSLKKIGPKKLREYVDRIDVVVKAEDGPGLLELLSELDNEEYLQIWGALRSWERTAFKKLEEKAKAADQGIGLDKWAREVLSTCKDKVSADTAWKAIQGAYDENGAQPPDELQATYLDIKSELPDAKDMPT